ncbi:MAG: hypothetical protein M3R04_02070, partial [bacterium]|nr:hypothetical protein [bacterium]
MRLQFGTFVFVLILASYTNSAFACCGNCDGDQAHDHEHGAKAAPQEGHMSSESTTKAHSFDGTAEPESVTLEPTRFVVLNGTLGNPAATWDALPGL